MANAKFRVVLIEEGLGNFGDMFYYTREALESAVSQRLFEGAKCYADHPDAIMERARPERSVRDIIGHFEDVGVEDGQTGEALLCATLVMGDDDSQAWAVKLVEAAIGFAGKFGKDFVGLSINAAGESEKNPIAEFLKSGTIPKSALPKIQKAIQLGNAELEVCSRLTEAVSCDLVTEAGAKGRVLKMVEGARLTMAKPAAKKVATVTTTKKTVKETSKNAREDGGAGAPGKKDGDAAPAHGDEEQDKELIKQMLKKYVGGDDHPEEAYQAMSQAHAHAKEAGMEGEEAEKAAGYAVKLAMHAAKKQAEEAGESEEAEEAEEAEENADEGSQDEPSPTGGASSAPGKKKESKTMEREAVELRGKVASLEARLAARDRAEGIEKALKESGLAPAVSKKFRESIKKDHSLETVTENLKIFQEAFAMGGGEPAYLNPEKSGASAESGLSFADCVKE